MEHWLGIFIALYVGSRAIDTFTRYGPQPEKTVDDHGHGHGGDKKTVEMPYLAPSGAEEAGKAGGENIDEMWVTSPQDDSM